MCGSIEGKLCIEKHEIPPLSVNWKMLSSTMIKCSYVLVVMQAHTVREGDMICKWILRATIYLMICLLHLFPSFLVFLFYILRTTVSNIHGSRHKWRAGHRARWMGLASSFSSMGEWKNYFMSLIFRYVHYPRYNLCFCFFLLSPFKKHTGERTSGGRFRGGWFFGIYVWCAFVIMEKNMEKERKYKKKRKKIFITDYLKSLLSASFVCAFFVLFFCFGRENRDFESLSWSGTWGRRRKEVLRREYLESAV